MPTYSYKCKTHEVFTVFKKMSDMQKIEPCPICGEPSEKLMDATAFILTGGGYGPQSGNKVRINNS